MKFEFCDNFREFVIMITTIHFTRYQKNGIFYSQRIIRRVQRTLYSEEKREKSMNSTHNIMALIETLLADGGEIGVRELGVRTGIPKSTVQRFLSAMEANGWVAQDKRTQGYRIGYKLLGQSNGWALRVALLSHSQDLLRDLCQKTGNSASLGILDGFNALTLAASVTEGETDYAARHPKFYDLHVTAAGKALLAFAPAPLQNYVYYSELKSCAANTITDSKRLQEEVAAIREKGYATSVDELVDGAAEIAVPLLNPDGSVIAVLAIGGSKKDVEPKFAKFLPMLQKAASVLLERLNTL